MLARVASLQSIGQKNGDPKSVVDNTFDQNHIIYAVPNSEQKYVFGLQNFY
jgi:hypothetical protein